MCVQIHKKVRVELSHWSCVVTPEAKLLKKILSGHSSNCQVCVMIRLRWSRSVSQQSSEETLAVASLGAFPRFFFFFFLWIQIKGEDVNLVPALLSLRSSCTHMFKVLEESPTCVPGPITPVTALPGWRRDGRPPAEGSRRVLTMQFHRWSLMPIAPFLKPHGGSLKADVIICVIFI